MHYIFFDILCLRHNSAFIAATGRIQSPQPPFPTPTFLQLLPFDKLFHPYYEFAYCLKKKNKSQFKLTKMGETTLPYLKEKLKEKKKKKRKGILFVLGSCAIFY